MGRATHGIASLSLAVLAAGAASAQPTSGTLIDRQSGVPIGRTIEGLLVDNAAGTVSAARLAGVEGETLGVVENVRDFALLINAFDKEHKAFGLSITPARTTVPVPRIDLHEYARDDAYLLRLLGALTLSYAQGTTEHEGASFARRAVSIETSAYWNKEHDPIVAAARARQCGEAALDAMSEGEDRPVSAADAEAAAAGDAGAGRRVRAAKRVGADLEKKAVEAYEGCIAGVLKALGDKWNRTRYSLSYATGSIKPSDGGDSTSLGRSVALGLVYGFDGIEALGLQDRAALTLTARRSQKEPVLASLVSAPLQVKNSTLVALRLSGGSQVFRGLVEASNAKDAEPTTMQRTFRRALGIDYRVMDGLWLNLRYGKQRKIDGSGDETGAFLLLNYSPSAQLGR